MKLFDVYPLFDVNIVKGQGTKVWDDKGQEYLDLYGGHAVISIGHSHPHYIKKVTEQLQKIGFYSNSVINKLQVELAERLGKISGYEDYQLFLINSGAEANENALKLASESWCYAHTVMRESFPRPYLIGCRGNQQSQDCCAAERQPPCQIPTTQRYRTVDS